MPIKKSKQEVLSEVIELYKRCDSIIDAIIVICDKYAIDIETISHYIRYSKDIKEMIRQEGLSLNLIIE